MTAAIEFTYRYAFASQFKPLNHGWGLSFATCGAKQDQPRFFKGRLREPRVAGDMLSVLSDIVQTHFFVPNRPGLRDPVVTSNEELLRFEGFSGCCGAYARVDLPAASFDRDIEGRGTTNVDFNWPLRTALTRLRDTDEVILEVGRDGVELTHAAETLVEKKVKLPLRWIKAFSEVQAYQPGLQPRWEVTAAEARRFLRSLPSGTGPKQKSYVVHLGATLRLTQQRRSGSVPLDGVHRARVLDPLLTLARRVRVWSDDRTGVTAWEVLFATGRFLLVLSPELYRGFSGEGQVLEPIASRRWQEALPYVQAQLQWQSKIDSAALAQRLGLPVAEVNAALAVLGSRGLAGFDVATGCYFHRELPFDLDRVQALQPRLKDAKRLVEASGVAVLSDLGGGSFDCSVTGTEVLHHVRLRPDGDKCTCPWFSKHQGERGPCKHVLAARMFVERDGEEP